MYTHANSHRMIFGHAAMASLVLSLGFGCDPVDDGGDQEELLLQAEEAQLVAPDVDEDEEPAAEDEEPAADEPATPAQRRSDPGFGLVAENDPVGYEWLGWFSEHTPPSTCPTNNLVTGTQCWGGYCNWMQLECHPGNGTHGSRSWTVYFSEENTNYQICPGSAYVSGISCTGGYCDNLSLECTTTNTTPALHTCAWSGWFSEEDAPFYAPWATAVKGVQCSGDNCDALRYYYCPV